jgi:hypothetical protein
MGRQPGKYRVLKDGHIGIMLPLAPCQTMLSWLKRGFGWCLRLFNRAAGHVGAKGAYTALNSAELAPMP